jgi:hypothetical protein
MARLDTSYLRTLLEPARQVSIFISQKPYFDTVASALGLKVALEASGKTARVICPDPMLVEFNRLVGVESVSSVFGSRNLIISFPEQTEHVDKVSYNLENGELQLVISPKPEAPDLDHHKLKIVSGMSKTDLIILMNVNQLADLGKIYDDARDHFQSTTLISVSHHPTQENYTLHQFHDREASSLSEVVTHLIDSLGLSLNNDAASNLLVGLEKSTDNFQAPAVSTSTFEAAVILMRHGAKRHQEISAADFPVGSIPVSPPDNLPTPPKSSATSGFGTDSDQSQSDQKKTKSAEKKSAPAEWYEPKIYKGPMLQ